MEEYVTFKKLIDKLEEFADRHPNINSFGFGNLIEFGKDVENTTPLYPLLFVVPQSTSYNEGLTTYGLQIFLADKLNDDNDGSVSVVSQMSLISKDLISTFKLNEDFMYVADFDFPVVGQPFMERFNDVLAGVTTNIDFNVSDYLDICQLKPLMGNKLSVDFTNSPNLGGFKPYGYLRVNVNGSTELELDGSGNTGNYEVTISEGDVIELLSIYPNTPVPGIGYGVMSVNMGDEPLLNETCFNNETFTFTAESTNYSSVVSYDLDCSSNYQVNVYTKDGLWTGGTPGLIGNIVTTSPIRDIDFGIQSGSTYELLQSYEVVFGTSTTFNIYDSLSGSGYQRTSIVVDRNGGQIYEAQCGSPLTYSFSATSPSDVFDVYITSDVTCEVIPTPTPTPTQTITPTPTLTPTITDTPSVTPTPSITSSVTPTPTPIFYDILTEGSDTIQTEGGDNLRKEQNT